MKNPDGNEEKLHSFFSITGKRGVGDQRKAPAALPREREPVPILQDAEWASGSVWRGTESLAPPPGFDPRTVQPVATRYTDWAIADQTADSSYSIILY
jgi:hypothetical protein